jgi:hypothetical protein
MNSITRNEKALSTFTYVASAVNLLLAFNFLVLVPVLSWLTFGHAPRAAAWIPDALLLVVLPAAYFAYWHYWFVAAVPAAVGCALLFRRTGDGRAKWLVLLNVGAVVLYGMIRIALCILGIRPDIV